ncbi:MAG: vitamin B12-dependent ribonucleotide reductase [bacterium]
MAKTAAQTAATEQEGLTIGRRFTTPGVHPFDEIEWELRDALIGDPASPAFEQRGVEFPKSWSQNATNIVAQKYFRGRVGSPERESSVKQMISRVAGTIAAWGREGGYFATAADGDAFEAELTHILLHQKAAFNSPVWFNVGFEENPQCSACFILSVEDTIESILDWNTKEGQIFRGGSGSGINLSNIRGSVEHLSKGGLASGPVSFMRGADAWAGTIKCLAEGTEVMTDEGLRRIEDVGAGNRVLTRFGPKPVIERHANGVKPLVKVTTELGNEITCTAEHRFLVRERSGETVWREAGAIEPDDYLILDLGQVEYGRLQALDPVARGHHNERELVLPQVLHEDFARWLGWLYGDGNVTSRPPASYIGMQIAKEDSDLFQVYRDLVTRIFGDEAHVFESHRTDKADASVSARLASTQVIRFLEANDLRKPACAELRVPEKLKSSPPEVRAAFLSGLFEADGGISGKRYPTLSTISHEFAIDVHRLLLSLGIPSKVRREDDRRNAFGSRPIYTVRLVSLAGSARFEQFVGFISVRKREALARAVERRMLSRHETDWIMPHAERALGELWESGDQRLRRAIAPYSRYARARSLSALRATELLNEHFELTETIVEEAASPHTYHTTAKVEPAGVGPVFDITVEDAHEYLIHNTVTHNSGGKTRRAAKMVVLDVDHPDIEAFIWCKAKEEDKAAALRDAGFDMSIDGEGFTSIQYQNANNSVRVTDEFMEAVDAGEEWALTARNGGETTKTLEARDLMRQIADAAWRCADPGVQYDTTINRWHTSPESGRINASNPCSEYMHVDDSACNLASLNLMRFRREDGSFEVGSFKHAVDIVFLAQEIVVSPSSYPTEGIGRNARAFRQLGLGYANLGALLMSNGLPYDSEHGRAVAAAITALMTGRGYRRSAEVAAAVGPYDEYELNREPHNAVMRMHRDAAYQIDDEMIEDGELLGAARETWDDAVALGEEHGYRNAQATVLAPTGTISFLMDCDTTGIEPDFSLVKFKELVGGGSMTIVNRTVPMALATLGYSEAQIEQIEAHINEKGTILGAPELADQHLPVFDVAVGERAISHTGHIEMMAATQPFISGAISKTVNLPETATVDDIADAYAQGWKGGLKALAIYRDGSKTAQALRTDAGDKADAETPVEAAKPERRRMPRERQSITHKFSIAGHEGYITAGKYEDGSVGEIFLTDIGKEGSTLRGMMNAFATSISIGLQYGVPLETFVKKFSYMRFDPEGITGNPEIPFAKSMPDYIMRWLGSRFIDDLDELEDLGILTPEVRARKEAQQALFADEGPAEGNGNGHSKEATEAKAAQPGKPVAAAAAITDSPPVVPARIKGRDLGPACEQCGGMMQRTGSCYTCSSCGNNTGCG